MWVNMLFEEIKQRVFGKRLLVLGAGPNEISLVKRAQDLGCYVVVTDNNTDRRLSPCKNIANEAWDISWSDIPLLAEECKARGIDGVTAGYSEFRVENVIKLCETMELPCFCTLDQLDVTRDKAKFKAACRRNGVPTVDEYASIEDVDKFPVIVKPVDRAGSIGVGVASDPDELISKYADAVKASIGGRVVIERFIEDGVKVDAYYSIIDGNPSLLTTSDTVFAKENGRKRVVQSAWLSPSRFDECFKAKVDPSIRRLIDDLGLRNGYLFVSSFVENGEEFSVFEAGFRLCGGHFYNYLERKGLPNSLDIFILHALTGDISCMSGLEDTTPDLKCVDINIYSLPGRIASIEGLEGVSSAPQTTAVVQHAIVGQKCAGDRAMLSKIGLVGFSDEDPAVLSSLVSNCYDAVSVSGEDGVDMIYDRIDPSIIASWWNN